MNTEDKFEDQGFDPSTLSYDEFVQFFFTHPPSDELWRLDGNGRPIDRAWDFDRPTDLIAHLTRLFINIESLSRTISVAHLEHGLDGVMCGVFQIPTVLWKYESPLEPRIECIRAMYHVFSDIVAKLPAEVEFSSGWMWWDHVCWNFTLDIEQREKIQEGDYYHLLSPDERALADCMFETILRVLALGEIRCDDAALHGLNHLRHPRARFSVQAYIDAHRASVTPERLNWLEACRDGAYI
jgi:hypothetical protein